MIPESREVRQHGDREYDRSEEPYGRKLIFLAGMAVGALLMAFLMVLP